jgi:hypothetical protein
MEKSTPGNLIKELILTKEAAHSEEGKVLKAHFLLTYESLRPINIIKSTFKEAIAAPEIKTSIANSAMGLVGGFIAKKAFTGNSKSPLTNLGGIILEMVVASKVTSNAEEIKAIAAIVLKKIVNQQTNPETAA